MAYTYTPCDGYFAFPGYQQEAMHLQSIKEYGIQLNKQRQLDIADQLSRKDTEDYGDDILNYMHEQELKCLPCVASIDIQAEIQWYMRPYLLDFLIEAHAAFGLLEETLFLAVNILDRYCSKRVVYRKHYQLVGCTALLIASKYGECSKKVPHIKELAGMCCSLYDEDMFIQMEKHVMITLEWCVGAPTIDGFLQAALEEGMQDAEVEHMALYISEIALFHRDFVSKRPSDLAKASLALARIILNRQQPLECQWAANYDDHTLVALSQHLHRPSAILLQKYRASQMSRVSLVLEEFLQKHAAIARCNGPNVAPPTPPPDMPTLDIHDAYANAACLQTPQKPSYGPTMPMTPPITPEVDTFKGYNPSNSSLGNQRFPATPTPGRHMLSTQAQYQPTYYAPTAM